MKWNLNLGKRIQDYRSNPDTELRKELPDLCEFKNELLNSRGVEPLRGIVEFLSAVSALQDRNTVRSLLEAYTHVNYGQHAEVMQKLTDLEARICKAGRNTALNRSRRYEEVSEDLVFLGSALGLPRAISTWNLLKEKQLSGQLARVTEQGVAFTAAKEQAQGFMDCHLSSVIELINWLEEYDRTKK